MKGKWLPLLLVFCLVFVALTVGPDLNAQDSTPKCESTDNNTEGDRGPENDSPWNWDEGDVDIPCDPNIYLVTGIVMGDTESVTRQTSPGGGQISGSVVMGYGGVSGTFFGPEFGGKGVVRLLVTDVPTGIQDIAPIGQVVLLKTTDIKAVGLLPGDYVNFKCRKEYEAVGAIAREEKFTEQTLIDAATYELDYCRLVYPTLISVDQ